MADDTVQIGVSRPSTTTIEQDLRTAGQRKINLIWEVTQASIALVVIGVYVVVTVMARTIDPFSAGVIGVVVGFYFGRTNHARIGDDPTRARSTAALDDR